MNGNTAADLAAFIETGDVRNTPEQREAAARTIAANATGPADALMLLMMCGLAPDMASAKSKGRKW